jgi:formylglycine-generating enzyme required for sulfatase activity
MLTLQLNAPDLATGMCKPQPNPIQRSLFIEECSTWHGSLSRLAPLVESVDDGSLRSAIALAVGSVPAIDLTTSDRQTWQTLLSNWYQMQPEPGIHSAAGWALRTWNLELPMIAASKQPNRNRRWYVNSVGMTMLELPAGSFVRQATSISAAIEQQVVVPDAFLLADCEVTRAQFQQFIDDPQYPNEEKPTNWGGASFRTSPTEQHPVQLVTWYDAVLFCNWLSRKEGLTLCYERTGQKEKRKTAARAYDAWRSVPDASGYRLPTEVEWEYACRAGSETSFHFGDDESLLDRYAVYRTFQTELPGSKLPNVWGLFDTHGNVWEWCQDWDQALVGDITRRSPTTTSSGTFRALRGGSFLSPVLHLRSACRFSTAPDSHGDVSGFRVARTFP